MRISHMTSHERAPKRSDPEAVRTCIQVQLGLLLLLLRKVHHVTTSTSSTKLYVMLRVSYFKYMRAYYSQSDTLGYWNI